MTRTASQRQAAHEAATEAWAALDRKKGGAPRNRVDGLAEAIRSAAHPKPRLRDRAAQQALHLARLRRDWEAARVPSAYPASRSEYFPHQNKRGCERRVRQMVKSTEQ